MNRLTRDGTAEPVSRDQILRRERGQGNIDFPCSADHEQDWQPYPVDPYSCLAIRATIHTCVFILYLYIHGVYLDKLQLLILLWCLFHEPSLSSPSLSLSLDLLYLHVSPG